VSSKSAPETRTWVVLNDLQVPFQDKPVLNLVLDFIDDLRPYGVILAGDVNDCYELSVFDKNPLKKWTLAREIKECGDVMKRLSKHATVKVWEEGNHEDRLRRALWSNPEFASLKELQFRQLFHLDDYGFKHLPYGDVYNIGKLSTTHGDIVRKHSGASAKAHFEKIGGSVLHGHTHRLGSYYRTNSKGTHVSYENGCLCRLDPEYIRHPDWQQGFSVVHVEPRSGLFNVQQIPILNRRTFFYGGERIGR
jgi:hypothetical protein